MTPPPSPRGARLARRVLFATSALLVLSSLAMGAWLVLDEPKHLTNATWVLESEDGYFAHSSVLAPRGTTVLGLWMASGAAPDRVLLVGATDVQRLVEGEAPQQLYGEWRVEPGQWSGDVVFTAERTTHLAVVWTKGEAWRGSAAEFEPHFYRLDEHGGIGHDAPVGLIGSTNDTWLVRLIPVWMALWWVGGALAAASGLAWAYFAWAARKAGPDAADGLPPPTSAGPTADMLRLVHLSQRYVALLSRYFVVSAVVIVSLGAAAALVLLPLYEQAMEMTLLGRAYDAAPVLFELTIPFALGVALLSWGTHFLRVRRELRRWRALSAGLEADAARILAPP